MESVELKDPNSCFKERYSDFVLARCPILVVRHAYSAYNHAAKDVRHDREKYNVLKVSRGLIDPRLHELGVTQAMQ